MKTLKIGGSCAFLVVCLAVLLSFLSIAHAQCTRSCGGSPPPPNSFVTLHSFSGPPDGMDSQADLVEDAAGNLYGTTSQGGVTGGACGSLGCGVVFRLDTTGNETVFYSFMGEPTDGASPFAGLVVDASGNLYGTTSQGGTSNFGTVFKLDATGKETVLYSFAGEPTDGADPMAGLVLDASGNFYGTTSQGGTSNIGTVFKLDTTGKETVLYSFLGGPTDGADPMAGLVLDALGNLYGTTFEGGSGPCNRNTHYRYDTPSSCGIVFKLDTDGTESVLHNFTGEPDGANPAASLVQDATGNLYGTTAAGGKICYVIASLPPMPSSGTYCGTIFKLDTTGTETVLHTFTGQPDGAISDAGLILDAAGNLYGTTLEGGAGGCYVVGTRPGSPPVNLGCGSVFKLDSSGKETVLYSFSGTGLDWGPHARLILDSADNLYGTTSQGGVTGGACGAFGCGIVFELTAIGTPADFSLEPASSSLTAQPGGQVTDVITVAAQNGPFASAVQLTCAVTGVSPMPTCALSPTSVTPGANSASSTLTVTAPTGAAKLAPPIERQFNGSLFAMLLALPLFGITLIAASKKARRHSWVLCGFLLLLSCLQIACGGGNNSSSSGSNQGPLNYTITVTGDANGGAIEHTTQITITVQ
jgi:uncharacterized repeat protein (TIGR03803 family)